MSHTHDRCALLDVQTSVYDRILADHPTYRLFKYEPDSNPAKPYLYFGPFEGHAENPKATEKVQAIGFPIEVISESPGVTELAGILNGLLESLTNDSNPLLLSGDWTLVLLEAPWSAATEQTDDPKSVIQHGTIRLSITVDDCSP